MVESKPTIFYEGIDRHRRPWKMLKADAEFHNVLEGWVNNHIFTNKTEATEKIAPYLRDIVFKKKITSTKPKPIKYININNATKRKIELEFK